MAVVGEAADGDAALDLAQTLRPDVLVVDLRMPGLPAAAVVRQAQQLPVPRRS